MNRHTRRIASNRQDLPRFVVETQRELVKLFGQNILPIAQQTLQVSMVDYQTGRVDFQQMQSNFQEVLRIQLMLERQRSQLQQTLASLERAAGGDVNATPARSERQN